MSAAEMKPQLLHLAVLLCVLGAAQGFGETTRGSPPAALQLRLANGSSATEGRVEVLYNNTWGTVCSMGFGVEEARVVCRQLGFPDAGATPFTDLAFGPGTGVIWLTRLNCWGFERSIGDCNTPFGSTTACTHALDAGVRCIVPPPPPPPPPSPPFPPAPPPRPAAPPVVCRVSLIGRRFSGAPPPANATVLSADVSCTSPGGSRSSLVNVTVGRQLLPYVGRWRGVSVSLRPGDNEWGLSFNRVPYMLLRDSEVRDLPLSRAPLLQCANCPQLELFNFTLSGLRGVSATMATLSGPLHATNLSSVTLSRFNCSNVRGGNGWACIYLQYRSDQSNRALRLSIRDSTFVGNSVTRGGLSSTHGTTRDTLDAVGHGMVVVASSTPEVTRPPPNQFGLYVEGVTVMLEMLGVRATDNSGGLGTFFSSIDLGMTSVDISNCSFANHSAAGDGGVIWIWGPVGVISIREASSFRNNSCGNSGGALMLANGPDLLNITGGSTLIGNRAVLWQGGAVWSDTRIGLLSLEAGSRVDGNSAGWGGGAISVTKGGVGRLAITGGSSMSQNSAHLRGGAVQTESRLDDVFLDERSSMSYNSAGMEGGAIASSLGIDRLELSGGAVMRNNTAGNGGGTIFSGGDMGTLRLAGGAVLSDCTTATGNGGAVLALKGLAELVMDGDAELSGNAAPQGSGGAIAVGGALGRLNVQGSRVCDNAAGAGSGGAIWVGGGVTSARFGGGGMLCNNSASVDGGGLAVVGSVAVELAFHSGGAASNTAGGSGGAIWVGGNVASAAIRNSSSLYGNAAQGGTGGALCFLSAVDALLLESNSSLSDNSAATDGGAIWVGGAVGALTLSSNSSLAGNRALTGDGGAIWLGAASGPVSLTGGSKLSGNRAGGSGGGLHASYGVSYLLVSDASRLYGNVAGMHGGGAMLWELPLGVRLEGGSSLANNTARRGNGGGLCLWAARARPANLSLEVASSSLSFNTAGLSGGAVYLGPLDGARDTVSDDTESATSATQAPPPLGPSRLAAAAAVAMPLWSIDVRDADVTGNTAAWAGGAVLASAASGAALRVRVAGSSLVGNRAGDGTSAVDSVWRDGGGLALTGVVAGGGDWMMAAAAAADGQIPAEAEAVGGAAGGSCSVLLVDSSFDRSVSGGSGGAVLLGFCQALIDRCAFDGNTAAASGGAVAVTGPAAPSLPTSAATTWRAVVVHASNFTANVATQLHGGALSASTGGAVGLYGCRLHGNAAGQGGGGVAALLPSAASPTAAAVTAGGNGLRGTGDAAAAHARGAPLEMVACSVTANAAQANGGGIFAGTLAAVRLTDCSVDSNTAVASGGGIAVAPPPSTAAAAAAATVAAVELTGTHLSSNAAQAAGGGVYLSTPAAARMTHVVLSYNKAGLYGGALAALPPGLADSASSGGTGEACSQGGLDLTVCKLLGNKADASGGGTFVFMGSTSCGVTLTNSTFEANAAGQMGGGAAVLSLPGANCAPPPASTGDGGPPGPAGGGVWISGGEFLSNTASSSGGGLFAATACPLNVAGTSFRSNFAQQNGGGMAQSPPLPPSSTVTLARSIASSPPRRVASGAMSLSGATFAANSVQGSGGGAAVATDSAVLAEGCAFTGNIARQQGGALAVLAIDSQGATTVGSTAGVEASSCSFAANSAEGSGGAFFSSRPGSLLLRKCAFTGNRATQSGGAVHVTPPPVDLLAASSPALVSPPPSPPASAAGPGWDARSRLDAYRGAAQLVLHEVVMVQNTAVALDGGAVCTLGGVGVSLLRCNLSSNAAGRNGGGWAMLASNSAAADGAATPAAASAATGQAADAATDNATAAAAEAVPAPGVVLGGWFTSNRAAAAGGALIWSVAAQLNITGVEFGGNVAGAAGGAIAAFPPTRTWSRDQLLRCRWVLNGTAYRSWQPPPSSGDPGEEEGSDDVNSRGPFWPQQVPRVGVASVVVQGCELVRNVAGTTGGAAHFALSTTAFPAAHVGSSVVRACTAGTAGGGVAALCSAEACGVAANATTSILGVVNATAAAAAAAISRSTAAAAAAAARGNTAAAARLLRGLRVPPLVRLDNVTLAANLVPGTAGASPLRSGATAAGGGAVFDGNLRVLMSYIAVHNNAVKLTSGGGDGGGGGVYAGVDVVLAMYGSRIRNNSVASAGHTGGGGGLHASNCSALVIAATSVSGCSSAGSYGGGVHADGCYWALFEGVTVTDNTAGAGGGIYIAGPAGDAATRAGNLPRSEMSRARITNRTIAVMFRTTISRNAAVPSARVMDHASLLYDGYGGGLMVTGQTSLVLSRCDLSDSNTAARGAAIVSTQRCQSTYSASTNASSAAANTTAQPMINPEGPNSVFLGLLADVSWWAYPLPTVIRFINGTVIAQPWARVWEALQVSSAASTARGCWPLLLHDSLLPRPARLEPPSPPPPPPHRPPAPAPPLAPASPGGGAVALAAVALRSAGDPQPLLAGAGNASSGDAGGGSTAGIDGGGSDGGGSGGPNAAGAGAAANDSVSDSSVSQVWLLDSSASALWPACDPLRAAAAINTTTDGGEPPWTGAPRTSAHDLHAAGTPAALAAASAAVEAVLAGPDDVAGIVAALVASLGPNSSRSAAAAAASAAAAAAATSAAATAALPILRGLAQCRIPPAWVLGPSLSPSSSAAGSAAAAAVAALTEALTDRAFLSLPPASFRVRSIGLYEAADNATSSAGAMLAAQRLSQHLAVVDSDGPTAARWALPTGVKLRLEVELLDGLGVRMAADGSWSLTVTLSIEAAPGSDSSAPPALSSPPPPASPGATGGGAAAPPAILESRSLTATVQGGAAVWEQLVASGWPGRYALVIEAAAATASATDGVAVQVAPLREPVLLLPCAPGQRLDDSRVAPGSPSWTACASCPTDQFGLWRDARAMPPLGASGNGSSGAVTNLDLGFDLGRALDLDLDLDLGQDRDRYAWVRQEVSASACRNCPDDAVCPGGPVIIPGPGYWHSAPNSTRIHRCPKPSACLDVEGNGKPDGSGSGVGGGGGGASAWQLYFHAAAAAISAATGNASAAIGLSASELRSQRLLLCQQDWYASRPPGAAALATLAAGARVVAPPPPTASAAAAAAAAAARTCFLWGVRQDDALSYMQLQCAPGYTGNLCGACQPGYYLTSDQDCALCLSVAATALLLVAGVLGSAALALYTAWTNLKEGTAAHSDVSAADVLKVAIVHMQYFVIICRLNIEWPNVITRFQGTLGAVTGAEGKFISSPSCLAPGADASKQAQIQLFSSLSSPLIVVALVLCVWTVRYHIGQRILRAKGIPGKKRRKRGLFGRRKSSDDEADADGDGDGGKGGGGHGGKLDGPAEARSGGSYPIITASDATAVTARCDSAHQPNGAAGLYAGPAGGPDGGEPPLRTLGDGGVPHGGLVGSSVWKDIAAAAAAAAASGAATQGEPWLVSAFALAGRTGSSAGSERGDVSGTNTELQAAEPEPQLQAARVVRAGLPPGGGDGQLDTAWESSAAGSGTSNGCVEQLPAAAGGGGPLLSHAASVGLRLGSDVAAGDGGDGGGGGTAALPPATSVEVRLHAAAAALAAVAGAGSDETDASTPPPSTPAAGVPEMLAAAGSSDGGGGGTRVVHNLRDLLEAAVNTTGAISVGVDTVSVAGSSIAGDMLLRSSAFASLPPPLQPHTLSSRTSLAHEEATLSGALPPPLQPAFSAAPPPLQPVLSSVHSQPAQPGAPPSPPLLQPTLSGAASLLQPAWPGPPPPLLQPTLSGAASLLEPALPGLPPPTLQPTLSGAASLLRPGLPGPPPTLQPTLSGAASLLQPAASTALPPPLLQPALSALPPPLQMASSAPPPLAPRSSLPATLLAALRPAAALRGRARGLAATASVAAATAAAAAAGGGPPLTSVASVDTKHVSLSGAAAAAQPSPLSAAAQPPALSALDLTEDLEAGDLLSAAPSVDPFSSAALAAAASLPPPLDGQSSLGLGGLLAEGINSVAASAALEKLILGGFRGSPAAGGDGDSAAASGHGGRGGGGAGGDGSSHVRKPSGLSATGKKLGYDSPPPLQPSRLRRRHAAGAAGADASAHGDADGSALGDSGPVKASAAANVSHDPGAAADGGPGGAAEGSDSADDAVAHADSAGVGAVDETEYMVIVPAEVYLVRKTGAGGPGGAADGAAGGPGGVVWQTRLERVPPSLQPAVVGVVRHATSLARALSSLPSHAALERVDATLSLPQQLRMVVMVSLFVLYAGWTQVALGVFACRVIDDGSGPYGQLQMATWKYGYWMRDMNQECYAGVHKSVYLPVGIAAVLAVCIAPPLASFIMLFRVRHRLDEPSTQHIYGFLYLRYKRRFYWWEVVVQAQTLALVAVDVFGRGLPVLQQALLLLVVFNSIAAVNMTAAPQRFRLLLLLEFVSLGVLSTTVTLGLFFVDGGYIHSADGTAIGIAILLLNSGLLAFMATMLLRQYKEQLARRGRDWLGHAKRGFEAIPTAAASLGRGLGYGYGYGYGEGGNASSLARLAQQNHPDLLNPECFTSPELAVVGRHGSASAMYPPPISGIAGIPEHAVWIGPPGAKGAAGEDGGAPKPGWLPASWPALGGGWFGWGGPGSGPGGGGGGGGDGAVGPYPSICLREDHHEGGPPHNGAKFGGGDDVDDEATSPRYPSIAAGGSQLLAGPPPSDGRPAATATAAATTTGQGAGLASSVGVTLSADADAAGAASGGGKAGGGADAVRARAASIAARMLLGLGAAASAVSGGSDGGAALTPTQSTRASSGGSTGGGGGGGGALLAATSSLGLGGILRGGRKRSAVPPPAPSAPALVAPLGTVQEGGSEASRASLCDSVSGSAHASTDAAPAPAAAGAAAAGGGGHGVAQAALPPPPSAFASATFQQEVGLTSSPSQTLSGLSPPPPAVAASPYAAARLRRGWQPSRLQRQGSAHDSSPAEVSPRQAQGAAAPLPPLPPSPFALTSPRSMGDLLQPRPSGGGGGLAALLQPRGSGSPGGLLQPRNSGGLAGLLQPRNSGGLAGLLQPRGSGAGLLQPRNSGVAVGLPLQPQGSSGGSVGGDGTPLLQPTLSTRTSVALPPVDSCHVDFLADRA